jgi:hypothetical protein
MIDNGGLQPENWDAELMSALREQLQLGSGPVLAALDAKGTTIEELAVALLGQLGPFTSMMSDLLALLAKHGIRRLEDTAEIVFDFDVAHAALKFDLEDFRRTELVWDRTMAPAIDADWLASNADDLSTLLLDASDYPTGAWQTSAGSWDDDYKAGRRWPPKHPQMPRSGSAALDHELRKVSAVWAALVGEFARRAPTRGDLKNICATDDAFADTIAGREHDYFLRFLWLAIRRVADSDQRTADAASLATGIASFFEERPYPLVLTDVPVERLLDFLDLPVWRRRHELYAAWVLTEIVAAAPENADVRLVHAEPGLLRFPFAPTRMAELRGGSEPVVVSSELRSPLSDPVGKGRVSHIQPDYSVLAGGTQATSSVLEVECKQYKRAATKSFADALTDYAAGRPNARVLLVSHGPLTAARVRDRVRRDVRDRTEAIARLQPHETSARQRFREVVGEQLKPLFGGPVLRCLLRWTDAPTDLDLHLHLNGPVPFHVNHGSLGDLESPPFALLVEDIREPGGEEEVIVQRWLEDTRYELVVHNFSGDGSLVACDAVVELIRRGQDPIQITPPPIGAGRHWHVASIAPSGELTIVSRLSE